MRYLCLIYFDERRVGEMPGDAVRSLEAECVSYEDELRARGQLQAVEALQPTHAAITVRVRNGRATVTDGPFAETKEQLGGFYLIEARDLNEAIRVAGQIPPARLGAVEVRPVRTLEVGGTVVARSAARGGAA